MISKKVPQAAVAYCYELWKQHPFVFKITRSRSSKLGDYRFDPKNGSHTVTVNHDLSAYQFLITYIHEVAHRVAHRHRSGLKPHGPEWKSTFRNLILPILTPDVFPDDVLRVLARHMRNPKASTAGDPILVKVLAQYDENQKDLLTINDLAIGAEFIFRKRAFRKLEKKRTRVLCKDLENGKKYLIAGIAEIKSMGEVKESNYSLLRDIQEGKKFKFKNRIFRKVEKKRTRSLCLDLDQRAMYSIPESMEVEFI